MYIIVIQRIRNHPPTYYLFNNDRGSFQETKAAAGLNHQGRETAAEFSDLDNDGNLDLFITMDDGDVFYHNNGDGTFSNHTSDSKLIDAGGNKILTFDMDQDGDLDLFIAKSGKNTLFRNNMDGTFNEMAEQAGLAGVNAITTSAGFGDFDDDGDVDLFAVNENVSNILYTNQRQFRFKDITETSGLKDKGGSSAAAIGDYNNDGLPDIFVLSDQAGQNTLYNNKGNGTFEKEQHSTADFNVLNGLNGQDAKFIDFDNDGHLDLLVGCDPIGKGGQGLFLFHNDSIGIFRNVSRLLPKTVTSCQPYCIRRFQ